MKKIVIIILFIFSLGSLWFIKPFYFSYASDLLPKKYVLNLKDMGDGSYEAAQYLNSLSGSEKMIIWTDKRGVCTFFNGVCKSGISEDEIDYDYYVVSSGRENRTSAMTLSRVNNGAEITRYDKLYLLDECEFKLEIGGRPNNFVKIIKGDKID